MNGVNHDLHDFMAQATDEMAAEYERIRRRTQEDPGTAGDQGEENWAELLRAWLPASYHIVTKGRILGHNGAATPQVDVVVLKPSYPPKLRNKKLYLAGGVAAAFECKTTVQPAHIDDAIEHAVAVKSKVAARAGSPYRELRSSILFGLLAHSHDWKSPNSNPVANVTSRLQAADARLVAHPRLGIDLVCLADTATWIGVVQPYYNLSWRGAGFPDQVIPTTAIMAATPATESQSTSFRPIGAMISYLVQKLAWEDPSLRDISDYYRLANLWGSASGQMREWPLDVYSESVRARVRAGSVRNEDGFDEWGMFLT